MADVQPVGAIDIKTIINNIKKETGIVKRKERIDCLNAIADKAKEYINDINNENQAVIELVGEMDDLVEKINSLGDELDAEIAAGEHSQQVLEWTNIRIEELEAKQEDGTITEEEEQELLDLYDQRDSLQGDIDGSNGNVEGLSSQMETLNGSFGTINTNLETVSSNMDKYKDVADDIIDSAEKYGRPDVAERANKVMDRNDTSWWNWSKNDEHSQTKRYAKKMDYVEVDEATSTYYDSFSNEYKAHYDVIEEKGRNQVQGALRKATVKVVSYGQTIDFASGDVKKKADEAKKEDS